MALASLDKGQPSKDSRGCRRHVHEWSAAIGMRQQWLQKKEMHQLYEAAVLFVTVSKKHPKHPGSGGGGSHTPPKNAAQK